MAQFVSEDLWQEYLREKTLPVRVEGPGSEGRGVARERLLVKYVPLVKYVAGKMMAGLPSTVDYNDLVSAGAIGLIGALDRYDPNFGVKFETFVLPRIRGAILDELRKLDWAPRSLRSKARRLEKTIVQLEKELGRAVTDTEVAGRLQMTSDDFVSFAREVNSTSIISLDGAGAEEQDQVTSMYDVLENPLAENPLRDLENDEIKKLLIRSIEKLPEQEKIVMALYYYEELTLREIGQVLIITESRVSQIHSKAIDTLRSILASELLS